MIARSRVPACIPMVSLLVSLSLSNVAFAEPTKDECIDANAQGQNLRREGKFSSARQKLQSCAVSACPAVLREDCVKRLDELESVQPSVLLEIKDASGADVPLVSVIMDGRVLDGTRRGASVPVDPGPHTFVIEAPGQAKATRTLVMSEGDRGRRERIVLEASHVAQAPPAKPSLLLPPSPNEESSSPGGRRLIGMTMGGVGLLSMVVGGVFGALTMAKKGEQVEACASTETCTPSGRNTALDAHSAAQTFGTVSTATFVLGGLMAGAGAVVFFTAPKDSPRRESARVSLAPGVIAGGGSMFLQGTF